MSVATRPWRGRARAWPGFAVAGRLAGGKVGVRAVQVNGLR
ncbi:hypothetical protein HMPREF1980_00898 [Actinomyces sp. oral taxon 172 str. F0311]|nr:hypothetical protein HMPREF1980_00898 [Actinomyces sp. oral taxon 172 str. F0311]